MTIDSTSVYHGSRPVGPGRPSGGSSQITSIPLLTLTSSLCTTLYHISLGRGGGGPRNRRVARPSCDRSRQAPGRTYMLPSGGSKRQDVGRGVPAVTATAPYRGDPVRSTSG